MPLKPRPSEQTGDAASGVCGAWVRTLGRRYFLALLLVAGLAIMDQVVVQPLLLRHGFYAPVINAAGRQRMLSQRLTKAALAMQVAVDDQEAERHRQELKLALQQWSRSHRGLLAGDAEFGLPSTTSPEIRAAFDQLQPSFTHMQLAAGRLADLELPNASPNKETVKAQVGTILAHEQAYLPIMDRIVGQYQREAQQQLWWLRMLGLSLMVAVLLLLVGVGLFVLRPATRTIQWQIASLAARESQLRQAHDELELRVQQRTAELQQANASLQAEILDRQAAEAKTRAVSDQLAHAGRVTALGQLATGLAHEINQPLAAITNYAETADLLLEPHPAAHHAAGDVLAAVKRAALRAGSIVRRMRSFVQPAHGEITPTSLELLVREVCDLCHAELFRANVALELELPADLPHVGVDAIQIQQVLVNLIQNAVQAMQQQPSDARHSAHWRECRRRRCVHCRA